MGAEPQAQREESREPTVELAAARTRREETRQGAWPPDMPLAARVGDGQREAENVVEREASR